MKVYFQEGEKKLFESFPQPKILVFWFFKSLFIAFFITMFIMPFIVSVAKFDLSGGWYFSIFLLFIIVTIIVFLYQVALRRSYHYYITNERVILEGGILLKKIKSVPYHKITDVSIFQNIIERMLGLSTVNVHTAGTGVQIPEIRFFGLDQPEMPQSIIIKELKAFKANPAQAAYSD